MYQALNACSDPAKIYKPMRNTNSPEDEISEKDPSPERGLENISYLGSRGSHSSYIDLWISLTGTKEKIEINTWLYFGLFVYLPPETVVN